MPYIPVRDLDLYYHVHGSSAAEPLILLHNFAGTGQIFDPFLEKLSEDYQVFVPDWRGHGKTLSPAEKIIHADLAKDIAAFIELLGLEKYISVVILPVGCSPCSWRLNTLICFTVSPLFRLLTLSVTTPRKA